jgi:hypothetical protein
LNKTTGRPVGRALHFQEKERGFDQEKAPRENVEA